MDKLNYRVRISPRARHVRLRITPQEGLVVVIPRDFDPAGIPGLLAGRRAWIKRHLERLSAPCNELQNTRLPEWIELAALGERWAVRYAKRGSRRGLAVDSEQRTLCFSGPSLHPERVTDCLRAWLRQRARETLEPWARKLGEELGLHPANVGIRNQKGRWGSCNARYDLSLNLKLLFLSPEQTRYVLVHELCHIRHRDHSPRFWNLVARCEPDYEGLNQSLRGAWRKVPAWV